MGRLFALRCSVDECERVPTHRIELRDATSLLPRSGFPRRRRETEMTFCDEHGEQVMALVHAKNRDWLRKGWVAAVLPIHDD